MVSGLLAELTLRLDIRAYDRSFLLAWPFAVLLLERPKDKSRAEISTLQIEFDMCYTINLSPLTKFDFLRSQSPHKESFSYQSKF